MVLNSEDRNSIIAEIYRAIDSRGKLISISEAASLLDEAKNGLQDFAFNPRRAEKKSTTTVGE